MAEVAPGLSVAASGMSGSSDAGELVSHAEPPHPSVAEAPLLAAVMFWPTRTSVIHIWSRLGTCAEAEWCWQASLTGRWCARAHGVCTPSPCCRRDITAWVGKACCEVTPPHPHAAPPPGNSRSAAVSPCFGGWEEDQTWRGIAKS